MSLNTFQYVLQLIKPALTQTITLDRCAHLLTVNSHQQVVFSVHTCSSPRRGTSFKYFYSRTVLLSGLLPVCGYFTLKWKKKQKTHGQGQVAVIVCVERGTKLRLIYRLFLFSSCQILWNRHHSAVNEYIIPALCLANSFPFFPGKMCTVLAHHTGAPDVFHRYRVCGPATFWGGPILLHNPSPRTAKHDGEHETVGWILNIT